MCTPFLLSTGSFETCGKKRPIARCSSVLICAEIFTWLIMYQNLRFIKCVQSEVEKSKIVEICNCNLIISLGI